MKVIPFEEKYRQDFINFNTDRIISNFGFLEEHDKETFEKIDEEMEWAFNHGAERLFIISNSKWKAALYIYKKFGFEEIKLDNYEYIREDIAFEYRKEGANVRKALVKKKDAVKKVFKGVSLDSLAVAGSPRLQK